MTEKDKLTPAHLIALTLADVDIFLLKESDQETDKSRTFTALEVREQLQHTADKIQSTLMDIGLDMTSPIKRSAVGAN